MLIQSKKVDFFVENIQKQPISSETKEDYLDVFHPECFKEQANIAVSRLKEYLSDKTVRGLKMIKPADLLQTAKGLMVNTNSNELPPFDAKRFEAIIELYIKTGIQVYSPGFMGRQYSGVVPLAGVVDCINSIVNQPSSFYEAAQLPNVAERIMANELNAYIGYDPDKFSMLTTSGGSLANLTALLAARNNKYPDLWEKGVSVFHGKRKPAVAMSKEAHYCFHRAIGILGIGEKQIVYLPTLPSGEINAEDVEKTLDNAKKNGLDVFCIVSTAGTTAFGAIDPIEELAAIASRRKIWLHVDGAHGGSLLISDKYRPLLGGIQKADSFTWDAHKMLFMPSPCTMLFYKDKKTGQEAFRQEASYVFDKNKQESDDFENAKNNFECTKRPLIMNLWITWAMYGRTFFSQKIECLCDFCYQSYERLKNENDFEVLHKPSSNILCFRYRPSDFPKKTVLSQFQHQLRDKIIDDAHYFISKVEVDGSMALRVVFMNHQTKKEHFEELIQKIRTAGKQLLAQE